MNDRDPAHLDPVLKVKWQQFHDACAEKGYRVGLSQTFRSADQQDIDYAQGRTTPGHIITNARGGQSPHNCILADGTPAARAFDFYILNPDGKSCDWDATDPAWKAVIAIGQSLGLISGSTWVTIKDNDHFELPNWRNI